MDHVLLPVSPATNRPCGVSRANSNTGYVGISLSTDRRRNRVYPCVVVTWRAAACSPKTSRIRYGGTRTADEAIALALSRRTTGLMARILSELHNQSRSSNANQQAAKYNHP